jgi:hypothetical protein
MLDVLEGEQAHRGRPFVRYADDRKRSVRSRRAAATLVSRLLVNALQINGRPTPNGSAAVFTYSAPTTDACTGAPQLRRTGLTRPPNLHTSLAQQDQDECMMSCIK